ncbi:cell division cycle protein 23-like isoform X1 [Dinothrombium tinctorium]|uniref:Cell division cycle protein 23-like isoform X1 n=1 Tax=Dinothrombium tinctorium TaxID=1965070 RepID=A0A3S3NGL6_9ACAR|nr:cell division cycle protein 23-like isoform X1 [Dinothrombium tinctorium]RWS02278.1 cell division cycle protein 23-like isoform X1 [Dinothrombium tinctorium]RWS02280.1 cell division cycle protein 23-like isoform X1 [Dinothrombium tinctorium]RWS03586.1 cell division cycle protein 23-like isoform X1 [Dinothrombium tinctorium]
MDEETIRSDLIHCYYESTIRGLKQSAKWCAELLHSLPPKCPSSSIVAEASPLLITASDYLLAKSCYDLGEYERCAHFTKHSTSRDSRFLYYYSRYMSAEKKRLDLMAEMNTNTSSATSSTDNSMNLFNELRNELQNLHDKGSLEDGFILYVYAIVLLKLDLNSDALKILEKSIRLEPLNWASWHQLALIIEDKAQLDSLQLPTHWFKKLFLGAAYLELQLNEEALLLYYAILDTFKDCNYIYSQMAIAKHNLRDVDGAIELFKTIRTLDPARLDAMDIYSNLLYVKDKRAELSSLAHAANSIDPFRVETCCCIANFYSLRSQHTKAVVYFSRALQLNPRHLSAWTLMGHEYMEMKNTGAAIQSYRSAIKCNKRDYRAWYGLGQTYEILKMPSYCLYYYSVARCLRPNDSRMMIATGETLEKLDRNMDALKCYWKAGGMALVKLAALYERLGERDKAAAAYNDFINRSTVPSGMDNIQSSVNSSDIAHAYKFLAHYYLQKNELTSAYNAAQRTIQFAETRDEGKSILKQIITAAKTSFLDLN